MIERLHVAIEHGDHADTIGAVEDAILDRWNNRQAHDTSSDSDSDTDQGSDEGGFDWDRFEAEYSLSAWDQLGEGYERDAAKVGAYQQQA